MNRTLSAFRLGDIRGICPDEIDEAFVRNFAHAFVHHYGISGTVVTGRDMRESSEGLQTALNEGLQASGIDVIDIGLCATELGYFASTRPGVSAAIVVTASHNPAGYNGLKCVLAGGKGVTFQTGLSRVMALMISGHHNRKSHGTYRKFDFRPDYVELLEQQFSPAGLKSEQIALNGLNGTAATLASTLASAFELPVTWFRKEPGPIPSEGADPVRPRLVGQMKQFMDGGKFAIGIAWDGDCDRCVFFDGHGDLVPTYYVVGLLAEQFLQQHTGAAIVFDTKLRWNTLDVVRKFGGKAIPSETGHAFMKQKMHQHGAVYGGELSSHHYFGEFFGCDSGMFAWLKVVELVNQSGSNIGELVQDRRKKFCCTPEINLLLADFDQVLQDIQSVYRPGALNEDRFDGLAFEMPGDWRFSLCQSKTESMVRLNLESRGKPDTLLEEGARLLKLLEKYKQDDLDWSENLKIQ